MEVWDPERREDRRRADRIGKAAIELLERYGNRTAFKKREC